MILTCPQCSTRYHVDAKSIGTPGRTVRCASCGNRWLAKPPADAPRVIELDPAAPPTNGRLWPVAGAVAEPRRGSASLVGWLIGVLVILIVASAVIGRNEIVAGFPASASIYQKLGLPITLQLGLQFEGVVSRRLEEGGVAVLVVEGAIVNVTDQERPVPPIRVTLLDGGGSAAAAGAVSGRGRRGSTAATRPPSRAA